MRTQLPAHSSAARSSAAVDETARATALIEALVTLPPLDPGRPAARDRAIEAWLPMAHRLTRRYAGKGEPFDDLLQMATIGLIKAIDRYDPDRGADFVSYAVPTVLGEIKRYFRDRTWSLRVPRRLQEMRLAISRAQTELGHTLNRSPTVADVADHLGVSEEAVLEGLEGGYAYRAVSLATPIGVEPDMTLGDTLGSYEHGYDLVELNLALPPAMAGLTERERQIVMLRFYGNLTQTSIAEQVGVSQMHVSRLLTRALAKLRTHLIDEHS
ncbi:MAG: SigB/SigF/SigG family RNA polymerase sigma factor [Actinoplanes sp.]